MFLKIHKTEIFKQLLEHNWKILPKTERCEFSHLGSKAELILYTGVTEPSMQKQPTTWHYL